jgi:fatty-acyl-CoA synthase
VPAPSLVHLLRERALARPDEIALRCHAGGQWRERTWAAYWDGAARVAAGLRDRGLGPGAHVLCLVPEVEPSVLTLFGAFALGAVPIQVGVPYRLTDVGAFIAGLRETAGRLDARALLLGESLRPFAPAAAAALPVLFAEELLRAEPAPDLPDPRAAAGAALIQLTSGSTGAPRGVVLDHRRLVQHMECMSRALPSHAASSAVSWLPLHHDMGLIGGLLFPFYNGFVASMMSPADFRSRPLAWLEAMSRFRGTISAAPPSAYAMLLRVARRAIEAGLDLSPWECAMIGAEPISAGLLARFGDAFAPLGFRREAFFPVYGLAEATVAVTFPRLLAATRVDVIDRSALEREGAAVAGAAGAGSLELVSVGTPIPETEVRIVGGAGQPAPERVVGEITVRAPTLMEGYYRDPEATRAVLGDGWLRTGDLGYLADGELFITGRKKELIIRGGLNLIPSVIEDAAASVDGVRAGGVAAVGVREPELETEVVYLVAETRLEGREALAALKAELDRALKRQGIVVDRILVVASGTLPKTTSGKLRRGEVARSITAGTLVER